MHHILQKPELLKRDEAADYIGVKESTLACWASSKRYGLPLIRVGRLVRYRRSDLDQFLESRTERPEAR